MKPLALIALLVSLAALGSGCHSETSARADAPPAQPDALAVSVARAHQETLTRSAEAQGALYPNEQTTISSQVTGPVLQVLDDFGDSVEAGQVLLKIDPREYQLKVESEQASVDQAGARLANARADYERARQLHTDNLMSAAQFDETSSKIKIAQADAEAAERSLRLAQKKLSDTEVRAPFKGLIQKRMVSLGEYVNPGDKLYEFIAIDPMKLRAPVPERFVPVAHVGMGISLNVDAAPNRTYTGRVTRIAPALDETSRTLLVEAAVPNPDGSLKPGYFAHVKVALGEDRGLFVPASAILRYAGVARVFVIENGVARSREVRTGDQLDDQIEIIQGLKAGELVATSDTDRLADGSPVDPKPELNTRPRAHS
ncbi:MAG TPA: efflux RND transporter periplasmic adaptor subunit [Candidatus Binataceae bacterium]